MKHILTSLFLLIAVSISAQSSFEELISKSYDYIEKDSLFLAELTLKAALKKEPANPINYSLLTNLGTIQRRLGKKQEALESYSAALSRQPKNTMILSNRASLYAELGNVEKAINDYTALLIQDPQHEDARYARGLLYIEQRNFVAAEADFNTILETNEKTIRGRLGYAILEKARGNYVESEKIFNYLIEKLPHDYVLYAERADLYFMMGKNARAMSDINKLFYEGKPDASAYVLRGKVKLVQYEKESAAQDFQKALEMGYDPTVIEKLMELTK